MLFRGERLRQGIETQRATAGKPALAPGEIPSVSSSSDRRLNWNQRRRCVETVTLNAGLRGWLRFERPTVGVAVTEVAMVTTRKQGSVYQIPLVYAANGDSALRPRRVGRFEHSRLESFDSEVCASSEVGPTRRNVSPCGEEPVESWLRSSVCRTPIVDHES